MARDLGFAQKLPVYVASGWSGSILAYFAYGAGSIGQLVGGDSFLVGNSGELRELPGLSAEDELASKMAACRRRSSGAHAEKEDPISISRQYSKNRPRQGLLFRFFPGLLFRKGNQKTHFSEILTGADQYSLSPLFLVGVAVSVDDSSGSVCDG
jgi:hypothetical protein